MRDQKQFRYWRGNRGECVHAIRTKGSGENVGPEIGLVANADGRSWSLAWDAMYAGQLNVGADCNKLKQGYAVAVATKFQQARGFRVEHRPLPNGGVQLVCSK